MSVIALRSQVERALPLASSIICLYLRHFRHRWHRRGALSLHASALRPSMQSPPVVIAISIRRRACDFGAPVVGCLVRVTPRPRLAPRSPNGGPTRRSTGRAGSCLLLGKRHCGAPVTLHVGPTQFAPESHSADNCSFAARSFLVKTYSAVIERDPDTGLFVGFVPGFPGAHSQGATLDELNANLREVIAMLLEDGDPILESEFVGVQNVAIA